MFAQSLEIKTSDEWKRFWLKKKMPDDKYPRSPQFIYGEEFKQNGGWKGFLGIEFMTYEEAKSYIQTFCFGSFNEYRAWSISENRPSNFYAVPHRCYDEFESYPEFIGYSQKQKQNVNNALELLDNRPAILAHLKIKRLSSFKEIITEIKRIDDDTGDEINRLVGENKKTKKQFSETIAAIKTG
ncbi:hypothetical protein A3715_32905 [Oleiphilus sp. HI0009]|nr:hypothetical protein A3715_32905 [Oleiphilus sp. HI0009]